MGDFTDQEITAGCISGDRQVQETFVRQFSDSVFRTVQYTFRTKNIRYSQSDVEDLHNTVFVKLFERQCKKLKQYRGDNGCSLFSWIRLITVRTVIDHVRKVSKDAVTRRDEVLPLETLTDKKEEAPEAWTLLEKAEQYRLIKEGMQALIPRYRIFIKLHFLKGHSIREVADIIGTSEANAHSLKHRAIKQLKSAVAQITK
jgi:RNA polymerase sigma factor (sigma-70 family)